MTPTPWWKHWINVGYSAAKRGGSIDTAATYPPKAAYYIRKGFAKWARHQRRVQKLANVSA